MWQCRNLYVKSIVCKQVVGDHNFLLEQEKGQLKDLRTLVKFCQAAVMAVVNEWIKKKFITGKLLWPLIINASSLRISALYQIH